MAASREFNDLVQIGAQLQNWLTNPNARPPITISTLTLNELRSEGWIIRRETDDLPNEYNNRVSRVGITPAQTTFERVGAMNVNIYTEWDGIIGPNILIIELVNRVDGAALPASQLPFMSQLIKASYDDDRIALMNLRHIFVDTVANEETRNFFRDYIYPGFFGEEDPIKDAPYKVFEHGTPNFQALLGTRIGKIIVYFLLNAHAPGTRTIQRIVSWVKNYSLHLRFDLDITR
ncbi:hypothetical protein N7478_013025 [Penicillium angulare]|uniref:uncharacterized protein n=1 Tax=Penicillium angulare TaxID=116970 RepID=UPI0025400C52|nr:uncharacterized protein N7478_013025 [Penicillium angulare]KAJ5256921.1 hypothetical protein N7478_013025 [Penicillium angulare]